MALQSIYEVLKEKESQLQELQRLLNEAQAVLARVLDLDAAMAGNAKANPRAGNSAVDVRNGHSATGPWGGNGSAEFP